MQSLRNTLAFALTMLSLCAQAPDAPSRSVPYEDVPFLQGQILDRIKARSIGPVNFGGRVLDFAVDERSPSTYFLAAASGGVFKTTNRGTTFTPVFDEQSCLTIGDIAVAPSNGQIVWVGTGEANNQRSSYWGNGIYKSVDGGKTWKHMGLAGTEHIGRIVVHPRNPDVVYVAALGALYTPNKERGLYRTRDGGKTWLCVNRISDDVGFVDVTLDWNEPSNVYAASYERRRRAWKMQNGGKGSAIWKSADGGDTWRKLEGGLPGGEIGRIGLEAFRANGKVIVAVVENLNPAQPDAGVERPAIDGGGEPDTIRREGNPIDRAGAAGDDADEAQDRAQGTRRNVIGTEVYRSGDAGGTWKKLGSVNVNPNYYYGQIRIDPQDELRIYVLGVNAFFTRDGGKKWESTLGTGLHVDHHALWIDPKESDHLLLGNDGGFAESYDGGKHWDFMNDLPIGQFYAIGVDTQKPYWVYGGLQDNGTWGIPSRGATTAGLTRADARKINGGDGFYTCIDPNDPDTVYSESQFGGASRQNLRTGQRRSIRPVKEIGSADLRWNWMTPILISPHDPRTIYVCSQRVHVSHDRGDRFETVSPDLTTADPEKLKGDVPHCTITTIDESPKRQHQVLVGTDDGRVWLTRNGGGVWQEITAQFRDLPMPLWVSRVHWSPHDADVGYVAFTGYREDLRKPFLYITSDGGDTWRSISNDLPQSPINVVREHPRNKNVLFVGHEHGLCVSIDRGASWQKLAGGMPSVAVHDLVVHPREMDLVVGTHGRGLWIFDIAPLEEIDAGVTGRAISLVPPRDGWMLRGGINRGFRGARNWVARNPELNPTFRYVLGSEADGPAKVEVLDAAERVLFTASGSAKAGLNEVVWRQQGGGPFGRGQGGGRQGGGPGGPASQGTGNAPEAFRMVAGQYRLRVTLGTAKLERAFTVNAAPDYAPGFGFGTESEDEGEDELDEEEGERTDLEGETRVRDR